MIQFLDIRGHTQCGHRIKHAKRMAPLQQFMGIPFMQCPEGQKDNIVDHVRIPVSRVSMRSE